MAGTNSYILRAKWVAPISSSIIENGAIGIRDGVIESVGSFDEVRRSFPLLANRDLGEVVILPGLINAHVHLELSDLNLDQQPATPFVDWLLSIGRRLGRGEDGYEDRLATATRNGIAQCEQFGVVAVGDITANPLITRPILAQSFLSGISFGEILGMGMNRNRVPAQIDRACDRQFETSRLRAGISPHAPYTVDIQDFQTIAKLDLPIATHLSESVDEERFLREHRGVFREVYDMLGTWSEDISRFDGSPIEFAERAGLLNRTSLLAHVNYASDADLEILAKAQASVVYCPRTHDFFGHSPHRFREMIARGINVCLGTDSCASSPDLNLLDDARRVHSIAPEMPTQDVVKLVTLNAARALGLSNTLGTIEPGKSAELIAFEVRTKNPLEEILESPSLRRVPAI